MSTRAEHYQAAEELVAHYHEAEAAYRELTEMQLRHGEDSQVILQQSTAMMLGAQLMLSEAQVHATLATASAYVGGEVGAAYGGNIPGLIDDPSPRSKDVL